MHVRRQIREAVAARVTGLATTGPDVFESRTYRLDPVQLPALAVYTSSESVERSDMGDALERVLELEVQGYAKAGQDVDDVLDGIAEEVERELGFETTLGGLVDDLYLGAVEMELNAEGDAIVGVITMTYVVEYRTAITDPAVPV